MIDTDKMKAYRRAKLAWDTERAAVPFLRPSLDEPELVHAVLMATAGGSSAPTGKYLREALAFAQADTLDAATLYIIAIREAHPAVREAQTA